ncbi:MAG: monovalent cation/H+ antiporter complex subunit F [Akkermansiaceae bacterium]
MYSEITSIPLWVINTTHIIVCLAMICTIWRLCKGPSVADRIVALDLLSALIMVQCALLVLSTGFVSYLDVSGAIAIISFLATVAFARYLEIKENRKS